MTQKTFEVRQYTGGEHALVAKVQLDNEDFENGLLPAILIDPKGAWVAQRYSDHYNVESGYYLSERDIVAEG